MWMFAAGHMVLLFFLGSHGTLVAVSAPFMMPLRHSDIPMNAPFTFSNKQPLTPGVEEGGNAAPRDATVPVALAPLDVGGGAEMGAL